MSQSYLSLFIGVFHIDRFQSTQYTYLRDIFTLCGLIIIAISTGNCFCSELHHPCFISINSLFFVAFSNSCFDSRKSLNLFKSISRSVTSHSLRPYESQHARPPCPSPTPRVHSNSCPLSRWCHPAISSSVIPFSSCPQSLPASESFPMSQLFAWGGQRTGVSASASFLPKNTQGWSPLEWTGWISWVTAKTAATSWPSLCHIRFFARPWTVAHQAPLSMEFSRQEYWSGLPFPSLRDLPNPGTEPRSSAWQADCLPSEPPGKPQSL